MLMMRASSIYYFLMLSLIRSVLIELDILKHTLSVKLIGSLRVDVGVY
jgi:hypothetical protein